MNAKRKRIPREIDETIRNEESLIGSVILNPDLFDRLQGLDAASFCDPDLGALWELLTTIHEAGEPIDAVLLPPRIRAEGIEIDAGRLAKLFTQTPNAANAFYYRDNVLEARRLRALADLADTIASGVSDATQSSTLIIETSTSEIERLSRANEAAAPVSLGNALELVSDELDQPLNRQHYAMTGIKRIDEYLGGIAAGEMHVIGARPSRGKTAIGLQIALHNANQGRRVLFCALEMTVVEMAKRVVCSATDIDSTNMRTRQLSDREREQFDELCRTLRDSPLLIWNEFNVSVSMIRHHAKTELARDGLDLIVVDYLGLLRSTTQRPMQRWEKFTEISNAMKSLAMELGVPILALQQLNRDTDGRSPKLSDLRDSGSIEQDADAVILVDYPEKTDEDMDDVVLDLAKNRHGATGPVKAKFHKSKTQFVEDYQWQP